MHAGLGKKCGIHVGSGSNNIKIVRPFIEGSTTGELMFEGIVFYGSDSENYVTDCSVSDGYFRRIGRTATPAGGAGIHYYQYTKRITAQNNIMEEFNAGAAFAIGTAHHDNYNCAIIGNIINLGECNVGIRITNENSVEESQIWDVLGNYLYAAGSRAIELSYACDNHIKSNVIVSPTNHGCYIRHGSHRNKIDGNTFYGIPVSYYGIFYEDATPYPSDNHAHGNTFNNSATGRTIGGHTTGNYARDNFDVGAGWMTDT